MAHAYSVARDPVFTIDEMLPPEPPRGQSPDAVLPTSEGLLPEMGHTPTHETKPKEGPGSEICQERRPGKYACLRSRKGRSGLLLVEKEVLLEDGWL